MARASDPQESWEAARDVLPRVNRQQRDVLWALSLAKHGYADFETAKKLPHLPFGSVIKRRGELVTHGLAEATGEKKKTPHGSNSGLYRLTARGRRVLWPEPRSSWERCGQKTVVTSL